MTCASFEGFDLLAYLDDPRAESFAPFRAHYPGCPECAAELRESTELRQLLQSARSAHPEPELLLRFEDARGGLAAQEVARIESHLASCVTCREELESLRGLDAAALGGRAVPAAPARPSLAARVRWLLWQPALAYALLLAVLAPQLYRTLASPAPLPPPPPRAEEPAVVPVSPSEPELLAPAASPEAPAAQVAPAGRGAAQDAAPAAPSPPLPRPARRARAAPPAPEAPAAEPQQAPDLPAPVLQREGVREETPPAPAPVAPVAGITSPGESGEPEAREKERAPTQPRVDALTGNLQQRSYLLSGRSDSKAQVVATRTPGAIVVRVLLPEFARGGGEVTLQLRDAEGRRELRELRIIRRGELFVVLELPLAWARPGVYKVSVLGGKASGDAPSTTYSFTIE